ncbi:MAG: GDYXXLXY domain-containing protein [Candidatus Brocadiia bacterium]
MKSVVLVLFAVVCVAQLAAPTSIIYRHETALAKGKLYKFRVMPRDPYDAFRGRYITLNFVQKDLTLKYGPGFRQGDKAYAKFEEDAEGFAVLKSVSYKPPSDDDYVESEGDFPSVYETHTFEMPNNVLYLNEHLAPEAERIYREASRVAGHCWVTVRVYRGAAILADLFVDGKRIQEFAANPPPTGWLNTPTPSPTPSPTADNSTPR